MELEWNQCWRLPWIYHKNSRCGNSKYKNLKYIGVWISYKKKRKKRCVVDQEIENRIDNAWCSLAQRRKLLENKIISLVRIEIATTDREVRVDIMHGAKHVNKYLNCQLYTNDFSDQVLKMASSEWSLYILAMTNSILFTRGQMLHNHVQRTVSNLRKCIPTINYIR